MGNTGTGGKGDENNAPDSFSRSCSRLCCVGAFGCSSPTDSDFDYPEAVITHFGFDFSAGVADTMNYQNNDGEVIVWQPEGADNPQYPDDGNVWWRNDLKGGLFCLFAISRESSFA